MKTSTITQTIAQPKDFLYKREHSWNLLKQKIWWEEFGEPVSNRKETKRFNIFQKNKELLRGFLSELEKQKYGLNRKGILILGLAQTLELYGDQDISNASIGTISKDPGSLQQKIVDKWDNPTTVEMRFQELKQFLKFVHGIPRRKREYPPCVSELYIERKKGKTIFDLPSEEKVAELIRESRDPMYKAFYYTLYNSGGRFGEIASLKVKDVEFRGSEAVLSIHESKTDQRKVLLLDNSLLAQYKAVHPHRLEPDFEERLFFVNVQPNAYGKPLNHPMVSNNLKKTAKRIGFNKIHLHALRHWRATHLVVRGMNEVQLKVFLGHSFSSKATARYLHVGSSDSNNSIRKLFDKDMVVLPKADVQAPKVCAICGTKNPFSESLCKLCQRPLGIIERSKMEEEMQAMREELRIMKEIVLRKIDLDKEKPSVSVLKEIVQTGN